MHLIVYAEKRRKCYFMQRFLLTVKITSKREVFFYNYVQLQNFPNSYTKRVLIIRIMIEKNLGHYNNSLIPNQIGSETGNQHFSFARSLLFQDLVCGYRIAAMSS